MFPGREGGEKTPFLGWVIFYSRLVSPTKQVNFFCYQIKQNKTRIFNFYILNYFTLFRRYFLIFSNEIGGFHYKKKFFQFMGGT